MSEKNKQANLKRWSDPAYHEKVAAKMAEINSSANQREKNRVSHLGKSTSLHIREKISKALTGGTQSDEANKKRSEKLLGISQPKPEGWIENIRKAGIAKRGVSLPQIKTPAREKQYEKMLNVKHSNERNKANSKGQLEAILAGRANPQNHYLNMRLKTVKGDEIFCHSSWEVTYAKYLDKNTNVLAFQKDKIRIAYKLHDKNRVYIVDFLVTFSDGSQQLIEIKPELFLLEPENISKFQAARLWCLERNTTFKIVSDNEIYELENIVYKLPIRPSNSI